MNRTIKDIFATFIRGGIFQYFDVEASQTKASNFLKPEPADLDLAKLIIDFYHTSKNLENSSPLKRTLGPSKLWNNIIEVNHENVLNACRNNDFKDLAQILKNVYRSQSTLGMTYPDAWNIPGSSFHRNVFSKLRVTRTIMGYKKKIAHSSNNELIRELFELLENDFGNPMRIDLLGKRVALEAVYHALILVDLNQIYPIEDLKGKNVIDLGSGLGICLSLLMALSQDIKCSFVDLPENLIYASWFLHKYCPDLKVNHGLHGKIYDDECDVNLVPYVGIENIPNSKIDLFINTFSLPEMEKKSSDAYLKYISEKLSDNSKLFSINRRNTVHDKGNVGFTMIGMQELIDESGLFHLAKEVSIEESFSQNHDFVYPDTNAQIALFEKN